MLICYVSDEAYVGLADVAIEFTNDRGQSWETENDYETAKHCRSGCNVSADTADQSFRACARFSASGPRAKPAEYRRCPASQRLKSSDRLAISSGAGPEYGAVAAIGLPHCLVSACINYARSPGYRQPDVQAPGACSGNAAANGDRRFLAQPIVSKRPMIATSLNRVFPRAFKRSLLSLGKVAHRTSPRAEKITGPGETRQR